MLPADIAIVRVPPEPLRSLAIGSSPASCGPIATPLAGFAAAAAAGAADLASATGLASVAGLAAGAVVASAAGLAGAGACGAHAATSNVMATSPCLRRLGLNRLVLPITLNAPCLGGPSLSGGPVLRGYLARRRVTRPSSAGHQHDLAQWVSN